MKVTFLGTGTSQGIPTIGCECEVCASVDFRDKRLRSSVLVEVDDLSIVIDTGPDFRQQMLTNRIQKLDAVLFTHAHKDHTAGMDDIRSFNFKQKKDMPIYGQNEVLEQIKREFSYIFENTSYPGVPKVELNIIENHSFNISNTEITPVEVLHYKLPVLGFRIGSFGYVTDAKTISDQEKQKLKDLDVLVLNALQLKPHISHLTLEEALSWVEDLKPKKAYFTHISHNLGFHKEVEENLPENVSLAYDGLSITM